MKRRMIKEEGKPIYDIVIDDSFARLPQELAFLELKEKRVCIVTETNVAPYYLDDIRQLFESLAKTVVTFVFEAGEKNKTLDTVRNLYTTCIEHQFDRKDILVALGGGVVGDLTGYTAATYLRGIDFVQIPTSLLSQVDSSIGGKTGVDFDSYKNMVGAFHQPKLVYINISTLRSLPEREYLSGMGEIIKHGLIKDVSYYQWLKDNSGAVLTKDPEALIDMIYRSCNIKGDVVERDPKEQGERGLLNFGHTLGHSIEKLMNFSLLHGECVMIGMQYASWISMKCQNISQEEYRDIIETMELYGFQRDMIQTLSTEDIVAATKLDKKMESGIIKFILLKKIGDAYIDRTVTDDMMKEALLNAE
ncbi:MAG: 3-dehydroquinate synthase [Lachnospiraceae bacterium]